jgi:hypothetical protein
MSYTLVLPVTEFTLRQDFEDTRLTVNKRNIWAVVPAGDDGRQLLVATHRSTGIICIPSDHDVEHEDVLGISRTHPTPVSAICIQPPDSGVGMRPMRLSKNHPASGSAAAFHRTAARSMMQRPVAC